MKPTSKATPEKIAEYLSTLKETRLLIAIDGRGGAGKSTLARGIASFLENTAIIEYDCFHLMKSEITNHHHYDYQRLMREVIDPFKAGKTTLTFKRYNWAGIGGNPDGYHNEPEQVEVRKHLIIEGSHTLVPELCEHFHYTIWLNTPEEKAFKQGTGRDIHEYGLAKDAVIPAWRAWQIWERESLDRDDRSLRADLVLL